MKCRENIHFRKSEQMRATKQICITIKNQNTSIYNFEFQKEGEIVENNPPAHGIKSSILSKKIKDCICNNDDLFDKQCFM